MARGPPCQPQAQHDPEAEQTLPHKGLPFQGHPNAFSIVMGLSGMLAAAIGALFIFLSRKRVF